MLPRFLIADNSQELPEKIFVLHTQTPRFLVASDLDSLDAPQGEKDVYWLDGKPSSDAEIEKLMAEAEEFLFAELDNQDSMYGDDEEEDEE